MSTINLLERVGFILQTGDIVEVPNISDTPELSFDVDPTVMIAHEDLAMATWHTHPITNADLSAEDYSGFLMWPDFLHIIVGLDVTRGYIVRNGAVINDAGKDHPAWAFEESLAEWLRV